MRSITHDIKCKKLATERSYYGDSNGFNMIGELPVCVSIRVMRVSCPVKLLIINIVKTVFTNITLLIIQSKYFILSATF